MPAPAPPSAQPGPPAPPAQTPPVAGSPPPKRPPGRAETGPLAGLRRAVRRYFGFSRRETSGLLVLVALLLLWLALPTLLRPALPAYNPAPDQRRLNAWAAELAARRTARPAYGGSRYPRRAYASRYPAREQVPQVPLAPFDPNTFAARDWQARGLPAWLAERLVKYRGAVGGFRAKEQLRKAYGLSDTTYARLAPYIQLPEQLPAREKRTFGKDSKFAERPPFEAKPGFKPKPKNLAAFDLNAADTTQLMQIRGIGRGYARRVVEYGQRLGGFRQPEQLAEIFAFRDAPDLIDSLHKYTFVAPGFTPARLDVNAASFEILQAHPYLGKRLARVLVAYRQQHGPFQQPTDLRKIRILDEATFTKLLPYIVVK